MSLYSKYRPQNFANLVGQEHIRQTILNEIAQGKLTHAYLFTGPRGTGKTSTARLIAKAINCQNRPETGEPCDECDLCILIRDGNLIDVLEIDAASNRGIDEIRDLKEKIGYAPSRARTKIYIIDEVHMLTKEAFNALLKTLEEPPSSVYFILCTTEIHKIPETIISRCQRFDFKRIDVRTIMTRLNYIAQREHVKAEDEAIELIAHHVEGGLRDAIGLFEQLSIDKTLTAGYVREHLGITGHQTVQTLIDLMLAGDITKALHVINEVHTEGYDLSSFMRELLECLRERLIQSIKNNQNADTWLAMIDCLEAARDMQRNTVIPQLPLEIAAIKICGTAAVTTNKPQADVPQTIEPEDAPKTAAVKNEPPPEINTSEIATQEEEKTAKTLKDEYEMEKYRASGSFTEHWNRICERVQPAAIRRSLEQCSILEVDEKTVKLVFNSRFHFDKINTTENKVKVERVIADIFGRETHVKCEIVITNSTQSPVIDNKQPKKEATPKKSTAPEENDLAKKAMELFGE